MASITTRSVFLCQSVFFSCVIAAPSYAQNAPMQIPTPYYVQNPVYQTYYAQHPMGYQINPPAPQPLPAPQAAMLEPVSFAPPPGRILSDPLYLPLQGQLYGSSAYSLGISSSGSYDYAGIKRATTRSNANDVTQSFAYGLTDDLSFHVSDDYIVSSTKSNSNVTGLTTTTQANGFTDPTFGFTWRAIDQDHNQPVDVDFTADYTPDVIASSAAAPGHDGNESDGRQSATFTAAIGRQMQNFTLQGLGAATYLGERSYQSSGSAVMVTQSDAFQFAAGFATQTRLTDLFSFNLGATYNFVDDISTRNQSTGTSTTSNGGDYVDATASFNYHFIPNRLVGSLTYDYANFANATNVAAVSTSNVETQNRNRHIMGARLQYVFN